jgi:hypothetical protein
MAHHNRQAEWIVWHFDAFKAGDDGMNQAIGENFVVHLNKKSSTLLLFIIVLSLVKIKLCKSGFSEPFSVPGGLFFS